MMLPQINYGLTELGRGGKPAHTDSLMPTLAGLFAARVTGKHKKDVLMLLVGERGSGKSYTLLYLAHRCSEEVAKRVGGKAEDYFTMQNVAVIQDEDLENRMRNLTRFNIYILDDAGVGWDSRAFATTMNRRLNHILQTCRTDNCILLISVIDPFTIDKVPRTMVRYYGEIAEQLHDYGRNLVKVFRNKRLYREGKTITPHMKFGNRLNVRRWIAQSPPPGMAEEYDRIRDENAQKVKEQMNRAGIKPDIEEPQIKPLRRCTKCGYSFEPRKKITKECPSCHRVNKGTLFEEI